jgi:hypothetical protein
MGDHGLIEEREERILKNGQAVVRAGLWAHATPGARVR